MVLPVLILAIIVFGMALGAVAQWILGRDGGTTDWAMALIAGIAGSFVGGLLSSLIFGDGLAFKPSGVIGSLIGALLITFVWQQVRRRRAPQQPQKATAKRR
jgi:uncharacterized membrane protein YeaQ/YmgE (transglycosylase-associated protein family)